VVDSGFISKYNPCVPFPDQASPGGRHEAQTFTRVLCVSNFCSIGGGADLQHRGKEAADAPQILALLAGEVPSSRVTMLVQQLGVNFASNDAFLDQVRKGGGEDDLVAALHSAHVT